MNYGLLLADLKPRDGESICLVRGLQSTQSGNGFDCPVLKMSHIIFSIPSLHIMKSVSVLHECGRTCKFVQKTTNRTVERAAISCTKMEYEHHFSNYNYYIPFVSCNFFNFFFVKFITSSYHCMKF